MSTVGSFDRTKHFDELRSPLLGTAEGALSADERKRRATHNLGLTTKGAVQIGVFKQGAPAAKTTSVTLTAAELLTGLITGNQGGAGAAAYTLPLATDLETALLADYPDLAVNDAFEFVVLNISTVAAEDITVTTNTGWTLVGNMVVTESAAASGANSVGRFRVRRTAANAYSLYRVG